MTSSDIRAHFPAWSSVVFFDDSYAKPTANWLLFKFYPWFRNWLAGMNVASWKRTWDCDDFAFMYVAGCKIAHAQATSPQDDSLAVGVFCYHSARGPHAVVCAFTDEGILFIEPQNGQRLALTPTEISTCFSASF